MSILNHFDLVIEENKSKKDNTYYGLYIVCKDIKFLLKFITKSEYEFITSQLRK